MKLSFIGLNNHISCNNKYRYNSCKNVICSKVAGFFTQIYGVDMKLKMPEIVKIIFEIVDIMSEV